MSNYNSIITQNNTDLSGNNTDLQDLLNTINTLPSAGGDLDAVLAEQAELIADIKTALEGKAGGSVEGAYGWIKYSAQPADAANLLLLHGESIEDSSPHNHAITNTSVSIASTPAKFSSSLYFNGAARLKITDWSHSFGKGDFTIDFWLYSLGGNTKDETFFAGASVNNLFVGFRSGRIGYGRVNTAWDVLFDYTFSANTWYHVAFVRKDGVATLFVNGQEVGSVANTTSYSITTSAYVGAENSGLYFKGYLDEFRVSEVARWTQPFTPPTSPYVNIEEALLGYAVSDESTTYPDGATHTDGYYYQSVNTLFYIIDVLAGVE